MRREKIENIVEIRNLYKQILMENQCVTLRQLAVSGRELMELGMKPGRELGAMLSELLEYVLDDPERNAKENLCKYVKEKMEKEKSENTGRKREYSGCPFHTLERNRCRLLLKPTVKSLVIGKE